ncbi:MAG: KilA-N domain-containing protein [Saprospiraceae bacterium]
MAKGKSLIIQGIDIQIQSQKKQDYLSLTDIAKKFNAENPSMLITNWMRGRDTIEFLGVWEQMYNPDFNPIEFDKIRNEAGVNRFILSVSKWTKNTKAIGIRSKAGRYGGTFAHLDIALGFCYWLSPAFQLYVIKEFQRLKEIEANELNDVLDWDLKRTLSKINYTVHTDAIKEKLIPQKIATKSGFVYANEADILNVAVFGMTAKEWRLQSQDTKGNLRDSANQYQLLVLSNLEAVNAELIRIGLQKDERLEILNQAAIKQMTSLLSSSSIAKLK